MVIQLQWVVHNGGKEIILVGTCDNHGVLCKLKSTRVGVDYMQM